MRKQGWRSQLGVLAIWLITLATLRYAAARRPESSGSGQVGYSLRITRPPASVTT